MKQVESFGIIPLRRAHDERHGTEVWQALILLHQKGLFWGFPKGHRETPHEPALEAAVRELKEETNLQVGEVLSEDPWIEEYTFFSGHEEIHKKVSFFPAVVSGSLAIQEEEIRDAAWVAVIDLSEKLSFPEAKQVAGQLLHFLNAFYPG